jgi:hypothetical protein
MTTTKRFIVKKCFKYLFEKTMTNNEIIYTVMENVNNIKKALI